MFVQIKEWNYRRWWRLRLRVYLWKTGFIFLIFTRPIYLSSLSSIFTSILLPILPPFFPCCLHCHICAVRRLLVWTTVFGGHVVRASLCLSSRSTFEMPYTVTGFFRSVSGLRLKALVSHYVKKDKVFNQWRKRYQPQPPTYVSPPSITETLPHRKRIASPLHTINFAITVAIL